MSKASRSCTVKGVALEAVPLEFETVMRPVVALSGTMTLSSVAEAFAISAGSPLKRTWLLAPTGSNPLPKIATGEPTGPLAGLKAPIASCGWIEKVIVPGRRFCAVALSV